MLAKAKNGVDREWLDGHEVNAFLKRAQSTPRFKELAVERICQVRHMRQRISFSLEGAVSHQSHSTICTERKTPKFASLRRHLYYYMVNTERFQIVMHTRRTRQCVNTTLCRYTSCNREQRRLLCARNYCKVWETRAALCCTLCNIA